MALPAHVKYVVIGAGIHGLSCAWNLAENLRKAGKGSGRDVLVLDKTGIAAGASGIACGVVRNNYFQPAMSDLMAACVELWESDPQAFNYHGNGYIALGPPSQESDLIRRRQRPTGPLAGAQGTVNDMMRRSSSPGFSGVFVSHGALPRAFYFVPTFVPTNIVAIRLLTWGSCRSARINTPRPKSL